MAQIKDNVLVKGMSGKIGEQIVIKQYGERIIVSKMPDMSHVKRSEKQKKENHKFKAASLYAKQQMLDPQSKAEYKAKAKELQNPYNVAIADFYNPPEIKDIDISRFKSKRTVRVHAIDDFKVVRVKVDICSNNGTLLEQGDAVQQSEWLWEYQTAKNYTDHTGIRMLIYAWDKPGNEVVKEICVD